eukprot:jgi/Tetstr1/435072/TSEL_024041.t1
MSASSLVSAPSARSTGALPPRFAPRSRHVTASGAPSRAAAARSLRGARRDAMSSFTLSGLLSGWTCWAPRRVVAAGAGQGEAGAKVVCEAGDDSKMTVAVTGATGLIGSRLVAKLTAQGHAVRVLGRNLSAAQSKLPYRNVSFYGPNEWEQGVRGCTGVVNLAGEPIATRWTPALKQQIMDSRVNTTLKVVSAINGAPDDERPEVLVSASAVGFYGVSETQTFNEDSQSGNDYLAEVCKRWEAAAEEANTRTAIVRIGVVLAPEGGALAKMLPVFSMFAGGPLGSGSQWFSWIHRDDLVALIIEALCDPKYEGAFNATAPRPVRMSEMCSALGGVMGRPSWLPVPEFALKSLLGEGASVVLDGQKVLPSKAQASGFTFQYQDIDAALKNIMR